jgi:hypothetical protein
LFDEQERISYVASRLSKALNRPLTSPGSEGLARLVLGRFQGIDLMPHFAEKAIETLRDNESHNRTAVSTEAPHVAVLFVAWNGSHREVQAQRYGNYLGPLAATAMRIVQLGIELAGFLEIDAYVRDNPDPRAPGTPLDEVFQIDVEYSYLPGPLLGASGKAAALLPKTIMLNPDLCSREEHQEFLSKLRAR